jgi:hypothetical protein
MRVILLLLLLPLALHAQPLQRNSIVLDVKAEQIVRSETQWSTSWGSFSRDYLNARILVISLKQIGAGDSGVTVRWYYIGRDYTAKKLFIYDAGQAVGEVVPGGVLVVPKSKSLVATREQTIASGRRLTGQHPWGWAVTVHQNGTLLAETASTPEMIDWARAHATEAPEPPKKQKPVPVPFIPQGAGMGRGKTPTRSP